jgi:site-specific recombinase XerC
VFLNEAFEKGRRHPPKFISPAAFPGQAERVAADFLAANPEADERAVKRVVVEFCRSVGQIPEKRVRCEFLAVTARIGCPEFTRVHDLRHLFSTLTQEANINPILVQEMLGHSTLEMTRRYTHLGLDAKRDALTKMKCPGELKIAN